MFRSVATEGVSQCYHSQARCECEELSGTKEAQAQRADKGEWCLEYHCETKVCTGSTSQKWKAQFLSLLDEAAFPGEQLMRRMLVKRERKNLQIARIEAVKYTVKIHGND